MTISTLDAALAGMQAARYFAKVGTPAMVSGRPQSTWYLAGIPGAGAVPANTAGGVVQSSGSGQVAGQLPHVDPGSGNSYLARFSGIFGAGTTQGGMLLLCDRLINIGGISAGTAISPTSTSSQTINSTTLPARDNAGSTNGDGVLFAFEVASAMGAGTPTITITYTNQAGTTGHTAVNIDAVVASSALGAFHRFGLQAGDTGIQSIQSWQASATMTSGTIALVGYRVLASLELAAIGQPNAIDALTGAFPRIYNGAVPFLVFIPQSTVATTFSGTYVETQG